MADQLQSVVEQARAPIDRATIDEKVETFERRLNGKILPFVGLHGTLIALLYAIDGTTLVESIAQAGALLPALLALAVAALCGLMTALFHQLGRARDIFGGTAIAFSLALVGVLLAPYGLASVAAAIALHLLLLVLNAQGRAGDYEINTVWVYLPFIFLVVGDLSGIEPMLSAVAVYGPAIYVKFVRQPQSNKLALGFSALAYLSFIIEHNSDSTLLIAAMVALVLALFVVYAFRLRHLAASSYRHFATDAIVMGLWGVLVGTVLADVAENPLVVWGFGVAAYQGFLLTVLARKAPADATLAERGARLAWLQLAALAILGELVAGAVQGASGIDAPYAAVLIVAAPFIPLFRLLRSPFLALTTRLCIAASLFAAAVDTYDNFGRSYHATGPQETPAALRESFLVGFDSTLALAVFALLVGLAGTLRVGPVAEPAWWRGLVRPRHMVLTRRATRLVVENANRIAFVGGFIAAVVALFDWIRFAGSDRRGVSSRDVLLIGVHVYAVAMTVLLGRYLYACCETEAEPLLRAGPLTFPAGDYIYVAACCAWGLALYLQGVLRHDHLARFFATGFIAMPLVTFGINNTAEDSSFLAYVVLTCCFSLFFLGLVRRFSG